MIAGAGEHTGSMERAYCFLGCLLLAAGGPLDAAKREPFPVSVFTDLWRGLRAGLSGAMPSEPALGSLLSRFSGTAGNVGTAANASSSILSSRLIETNSRAACLWSFLLFFPQTGEGGCEGSVWPEHRATLSTELWCRPGGGRAEGPESGDELSNNPAQKPPAMARSLPGELKVRTAG